jgi:hypothetical protein
MLEEQEGRGEWPGSCRYLHGGGAGAGTSGTGGAGGSSGAGGTSGGGGSGSGSGGSGAGGWNKKKGKKAKDPNTLTPGQSAARAFVRWILQRPEQVGVIFVAIYVLCKFFVQIL